MWRMRRDSLRSHAVIRLNLDRPMVIWFLNDKAVGCRSFSDLTGALRWTEQLKAQNWTAGWRLTPD